MSERVFFDFNSLCGASDREDLHFIPFVMSTDGALGPAAQQLVDRLATLLSDKWRVGLGTTKTYVKARLAMAIAGGASACFRGSRIQQRRPVDQELEPDFQDGAGLGRLLHMGSGGGGGRGE